MVRKIRQAAVIGAGVMGSGIAALMASAGISTLLLDVVPEDLPPEKKVNKKSRNRLAQSGLDHIAKTQPPTLMYPSDIHFIQIGNLEDDFSGLKDCDLIIEAVIEDLQIKQALFHRIAAVRNKDCIVTTNTSGLPLKSLTDGLDDGFKKHFMGTHFFNPVRYMRLVELIAGEQTLPDICEFIEMFCEKHLGKGVVWAKDTPNFIANRLGVYHMVRAMQRMVENGLTISAVDGLFGPLVGRPKTAIFKTCDLVGIDTLVKVAGYAFQLLDTDTDRDGFKPPEFLTRMVQNGLLGKKSKAGFYKTQKGDDGKITRFVIDPETLHYDVSSPVNFPSMLNAADCETLNDRLNTVAYAEDEGGHFFWTAISDYLLYAAKRIGDIADSIVDMDCAMKWGFNFEQGPFETWDALGLEKSINKMKTQGRSIPTRILKMLDQGCSSFYKIKNGKRFYYDFDHNDYLPVVVDDASIRLADIKAAGDTVLKCPSASLIDLGDDIFCCEFHTKMNVINGEIIDFIHDSIDFVDQNGAGLVIGNQTEKMPGAFSAGGDLHQMAKLAGSGRYSDLDTFLDRAQQVMVRSRYSHFPVIAAPYGMTLGGGCEVCIGAADKIVAHCELYMGLVEIAVGLLPAAGGCLNFWKKLTSGLPEAAGDVDLSKFFVAAFKTIAMAKVSSSARHALSIGFLNTCDRIVMNRDQIIGEAKKEALSMALSGYHPPQKKPVKVFGDAGKGMVSSELDNLFHAGKVSQYDRFLANRIAHVISGGDVRTGSEIDETVILKLERQAFVDFWREENTRKRVEHMLKTGKPLRN